MMSIMWNKLYSICAFKCPKCLKGEFFESHPYNLRKIGEVKTHCPKCKTNYILEPGFYFGAMYVSYALGVGVFVLIWLLCDSIFHDDSVWITISIISGSIFLLSPLMFSLSKIIWANIFIHYDEKKNSESFRA